MKKVLCLLLSAMLSVSLILLVSCGSDSDTKTNYTDTLSAPELAEKVIPSLENSNNMTQADDFYIEATMQLDTSLADSYYISIANGGTIVDEIGIFKFPDETKANDMKPKLEEYLKYIVDSYNDLYLPQELPKFQNAQVKVFGKYTVYAALSDTERTSFFNSIESNLK